MKNLFLKMVRTCCVIIPVSLIWNIYVQIEKIPWLRKIFDAIVTRLIPDYLSIPEGKLLLNKKDAVTSVSIAFGIYEQFEIAVFKKNLRGRMKVIDVGANIGYYSMIASKHIGPNGVVYAFEPDQENYDLLKQNINLNNLSNVKPYQLALSNKTGEETLYLSSYNKGDHRLYQPENANRKTVTINATTLDDFCHQQQLQKIDIIKIDVQGAEGLVLEGMKTVIRNNPKLTIFSEFFPRGIRATKVDPTDYLIALHQLGFKLNYINEDRKKLLPITDFKLFTEINRGKKYSNLICIRK